MNKMYEVLFYDKPGQTQPSRRMHICASNDYEARSKAKIINKERGNNMPFRTTAKAITGTENLIKEPNRTYIKH